MLPLRPTPPVTGGTSEAAGPASVCSGRSGLVEPNSVLLFVVLLARGCLKLVPNTRKEREERK
jgi:hypothetical protein